MIVDYTPASGLRLLEAEDLKRFKLRLAGGVARPEIDGVAFVDDENALIQAQLPPSLPGAPTTAEWRAGYQVMIDYAAKKGWIDQATGAIRAHVEHVPQEASN
jgi:hypothetical protein